MISFSVTREDGLPSKQFELKAGDDKAVRIGRAPGNDIVVAHRGVSQYHAELRLTPDSGLVCKDLSMNGTGMKKATDKQATSLTKGIDAPVPDGAVVGVPMMLKDSFTSSDRTWLQIKYGASGPGAVIAASAKPKAPPAARTNSDPPPAKTNGAHEQDDDDDGIAEKNRMQFVELLLKSREIASGTNYEEAMRLLREQPAWRALDDQTRRECFEIFVEHLGSNHKKEKKDKGKKKEKRKHKDDEEDAAPRNESPVATKASPEASRVKRRREKDRKQGSASPDRHRKSKRDKEYDRDRSPSGRRRDRSRERKRRGA